MLTKTETYQHLLPPGCSVRAGQLSDYLLAFDLVNLYYQRFAGNCDLLDPEIIRIDWLNEGFNPQTDIHMVLGPDGAVLGMVEVWVTAKPPVHPWCGLHMHPDYLQTGIPEYLMRWAEEQTHRALELAPAELRVAPISGVLHSDPHTAQVLQHLGWKHERSFYRMAVELESKPVVPVPPAGIVIRPYDTQTETEAVYRAMIDSFRDHYGFYEQPFEHGFAEFKHNMINVPGYDASCWFVAADGNEIAGICLCNPKDLEDAESGWVNELGVRRAWRKKGLGYAMLMHAIAEFYARGQKRAALGVDATSLTGALRLYERAGMRVARQFDRYEKELRGGKELGRRTIEEE